MKKIGRLVANLGKYQKNGEDKTRWHTCGALFQREDGSFAVKMDAYPATGNGWFGVFEDEQNQEQHPERKPESQARPKANRERGFRDPPPSFDDDDIPF